MSRAFYNKKRTRRDTFTMEVNANADAVGKPDAHAVSIVFEDGCFVGVEVDGVELFAPESRDDWRLVAAIAAEIAEVEASYSAAPERAQTAGER